MCQLYEMSTICQALLPKHVEILFWPLCAVIMRELFRTNIINSSYSLSRFYSCSLEPGKLADTLAVCNCILLIGRLAFHALSPPHHRHWTLSCKCKTPHSNVKFEYFRLYQMNKLLYCFCNRPLRS